MYRCQNFVLIKLLVEELGGGFPPLVPGVGTKHLGPVRVNNKCAADTYTKFLL